MVNRQEVHVPVIRKWCVSLGILTSISISREEAEMKLAVYLPMLMNDFTDAAFTQDSLNHVVKQCVKGFPTYPELYGYLREWWQINRPQAPRITVEGSSLAAAQREQERLARESWDNPQAIAESVNNCAGNRTFLKMLASAVQLYAPQHRHLVPIEDEKIDVGSPPRDERAPVQPRYLTPEQLTVARQGATECSI